jgi:DNA-binding transcriptional MerR regulator
MGEKGRRMRIGELSRRCGVSTKAIRYYESIGLIAEPPREATGYRRYGDADLSRLRFIASAKQLGLALAEIKDVLGATDQQEVSCPHVVALLEAKRDRIEQWIASAQAMRDVLASTLEASRELIAAPSAPADCCPVVERGLHERALRIVETEDHGTAWAGSVRGLS